jgi:cobalt-zinc-cadmium efflux system outer membrane protein
VKICWWPNQTIKLTEAKVENGDLARVELYRAQAASLQYQQSAQQARTAYQQATRDILMLLGARAEDISLTRPAVGGASSSETQIIKASFNTGNAGNTGNTGEVGTNANGPALVNPLNSEPLEIDFNFDDRPISQTLAELRNIALAERPDVIAARCTYGASTRVVELARAQRARDVLIGVFFQRVGSDQTAGVNVSFPLFIHNNGYAAISQAASQEEAATSLTRQAELQAVTDVEKAYLAYLSARRILDLYNSSTLERAGKLKNVAVFSYREGATSLLDLLADQRIYNQTISSYNQARADYQLALWQLEQAVGRPLR